MTVNEVQAAFHCFFVERVAAAGQWLEAFQTSTQAWSTTNLILGNKPEAVHLQGVPDSRTQILTFAAQTLRMKVQNQIQEMNHGDRFSLRDALVGHIHKFGDGPPQVRVLLLILLGIRDPVNV